MGRLLFIVGTLALLSAVQTLAAPYNRVPSSRYSQVDDVDVVSESGDYSIQVCRRLCMSEARKLRSSDRLTYKGAAVTPRRFFAQCLQSCMEDVIFDEGHYDDSDEGDYEDPEGEEETSEKGEVRPQARGLGLIAAPLEVGLGPVGLIGGAVIGAIANMARPERPVEYGSGGLACLSCAPSPPPPPPPPPPPSPFAYLSPEQVSDIINGDGYVPDFEEGENNVGPTDPSHGQNSGNPDGTDGSDTAAGTGSTGGTSEHTGEPTSHTENGASSESENSAQSGTHSDAAVGGATHGSTATAGAGHVTYGGGSSGGNTEHVDEQSTQSTAHKPSESENGAQTDPQHGVGEDTHSNTGGPGTGTTSATGGAGSSGSNPELLEGQADHVQPTHPGAPSESENKPTNSNDANSGGQSTKPTLGNTAAGGGGGDPGAGGSGTGVGGNNNGGGGGTAGGSTGTGGVVPPVPAGGSDGEHRNKWTWQTLDPSGKRYVMGEIAYQPPVLVDPIEYANGGPGARGSAYGYKYGGGQRREWMKRRVEDESYGRRRVGKPRFRHAPQRKGWGRVDYSDNEY